MPNPPPVQPEKKTVWIACRATEGCPGNQAEIVFSRSNNPAGADGGFFPAAGGRTIRYRCQTCGKPFHVRT